jgi:VanZ family protein
MNRLVGFWAVALLVALTGSQIYVSAYLPALLGASVGTIISAAFSSEERRWPNALSLAYLASVTLGWTVPAELRPGVGASALTFQIVLGALIFGGWIVVFRTLGDRKPFWGLLVVYALGVCVSYLSSSAGGAGPMIGWLIGHGLSESQAHAVTLAFRKTVHFTHYGTLGIAGGLAANTIRKPVLASACVGLGIVFCTACFDELRQASQPGRTASAWDVALDMAGGLVFVSIALWLVSRKRG